MELSVKEFEKIMQTYFDKGADAIDKQYRPLIVANKQAGERIRELEEKNEKLKERVGLLSLESADFEDRWLKEQDKVIELEKQLEQQKKQIEEYQSFFSLMRKLLPRVPSIHDVIC